MRPGDSSGSIRQMPSFSARTSEMIEYGGWEDEGGSPYYILLALVKNSRPARIARIPSRGLTVARLVGVYKKAVAAVVVTAIKSGEAGRQDSPRAEPSFRLSLLAPLQNAASDDRPGTATDGGNYGVPGFSSFVGRAT